jgi:hypothetical protein
MNAVTIRGFACSYEEQSRSPATFDDDKVGIVSRGAFAEFVSLNLPCVLQFGGHAANLAPLASRDEGTLEVFDSPHGLCFEAQLYAVECKNLPLIIRSIQSGYGCSVDFSDTITEETVINGIKAWRTSKASCSHIALVENAAYRNAVCWVEGRHVASDNHAVHLAQQRWNEAHHAYCLVLAKSLDDRVEPTDAIEEARAKLSMGETKKGRAALIRSPKKQSATRLSADLFKLLFQNRDHMQAQIADLERRIAALEGERD